MAEETTSNVESTVREIRRRTRKPYSAEEKVRTPALHGTVRQDRCAPMASVRAGASVWRDEAEKRESIHLVEYSALSVKKTLDERQVVKIRKLFTTVADKPSQYGSSLTGSTGM